MDFQVLSRRGIPCLIVLIIISGCAAPAGSAGQVRLALLPILDSLPVHVALQEGYFAEEGLDVEVLPVSSAPERDQLIAAGKADGMINELVSTMFFNHEEQRVQVVRTARAATPENAVFRILASQDAGITKPEDLRGVPIGISEGTVIEYLTDRLLTAEGIAPDEIKKIAVPRIPDRLALLSSGELSAAVLPDPLASLAIQEGAVVVLDDSAHPRYGLSVYSFRKEFLAEEPQTARRFLRALERAVISINRDPEMYAGLLMEKELVPAALIEGYQVPPFPTAAVPGEDQWEDALSWALEKQLLERRLAYDKSITGEYLPGD